MTTIFEKIIAREVPADIVHEDEHCLVIKDIAPQAPLHLLIIPKSPIARLADAKVQHQELLGHLMLTAGEIARQHEVEDAFRLIVNNGEQAGQTVFHLHIHLLAGTRFEEGMV